MKTKSRLRSVVKYGIISSKIYDKRDYFNFVIVIYPHLDEDVPRATSYGVYISQLIRFARACSSLLDFHIRKHTITERLLKQGYRYNTLRKSFSKFYYRNLPLISKYRCTLRSHLRQRIFHPVFYDDVNFARFLDMYFFKNKLPTYQIIPKNV